MQTLVRALAVPLMIGLLSGSWQCPVTAQDNPGQDSLLIQALLASIGGFPPGYSAARATLAPTRTHFESLKGVELFAAGVRGPHDVWVVGMAARLPGGSVLPLGSPITRRMLTGYVTYQSGMSDEELITYAIELARLDGAIPFDAPVFSERTDTSFAGVPARVLGDARAPRVEPQVDASGRAEAFRRVTFFAKVQYFRIRRVEVAVMNDQDRFDDLVWATLDLP